MADLWAVDEFGERWLENPALIVSNRNRRKKTMARRKRRQPEALRRYWAARKAKKNYQSAGMIANPKRKRKTRSRPARAVAYASNPRRRRSTSRRYRRNPSLMGFSLPPIDAVIFTGAGLVVPPMVTSFVMGYLPESWKTSRMTYYAVKAGAVIVPSMLVRQLFNQRAGNLMLLGGAASFVVDLIREFGLLPTGVGSQPFLGQYVNMRRGGMGKYVSPGSNGGAPMGLPPMIATTPDRLSPTGRF